MPPLPLELFYEIALHLPLTKDVLALSLTSSCIRRELSTLALFKERLALRRWDMSAWEDEDAAAGQSPGDLVTRWMCIDHTYCRTIQLFEEAIVDSHFLITPNSPTYDVVLWVSKSAQPDQGQDNQSPNLQPVVDGDKTAAWLKKLSKVFPLFVTHHRGRNILRITDPKYRDVLLAYAKVVGDLCTIVMTVYPDGTPKQPQHRIDSSDYSWFEPICFSLIALLIQCDTTTIVSIFTDTSDLDPIAFGWAVNEPPAALPDASLTLESISERYFDTFLFQAVLCVSLHLDAAHSDTPEQHPLLAPSLAHFDPRSSPSYSYYSYFGNGAGVPLEPGTPTITELQRCISATIPLYSPSCHMRPWLCEGLAGTPLANLSSTTGTAWAGYYTYFGIEDRDPTTYIELRAAPPPPSDSDNGSDPNRRSYFSGGGYDGAGSFTLTGWCDTHTGHVSAIKAYEVHEWEWRGMLTPFGMAGIWGPVWGGGRWWIWPREWSFTTT